MLQKITLGLIVVYQKYIRIWLPSVCRFSPSCSEYAGQAIKKYGFFKGGGLAVRRLLRCHPFCSIWGYDPLK